MCFVVPLRPLFTLLLRMLWMLRLQNCVLVMHGAVMFPEIYSFVFMYGHNQMHVCICKQSIMLK